MGWMEKLTDKESSTRLLADILEQIKSLDAGTVRNQAHLENNYPIPAILSLGDRGQMIITPEIDQKIGAFAEYLMDDAFSSCRSRFRNTDWRRLVRKSLGTTLSRVDIPEINPDESACSLLSKIKKYLKESIDNIEEREFVFGCHLSSFPDLQPIRIGPVVFEPRDVWLGRTHQDGKVSKVARSRIERAWQGKRLRPRVRSRDAEVESQILRTVDNGDYVCTVTIGPAGFDAGLQKSLIAARLAMATVALGCIKPSRAIGAMALVRDRQFRMEEYVAFSSSGPAESGNAKSFVPGGIHWLTEQEWAELPADFENEFDCAGKAIRYFTHGDRAVERPKIMKALFQALLWFYEGSIESVDVMAIVKFCSCMEALACGKRKKGISNLIQSHLVVESVPKLERDLKRLYDEGRSRAAHGTSDRLEHDWSDDRQLAEFLAHRCLISSLERTATNCGSDDPNIFLKTVCIS